MRDNTGGPRGQLAVHPGAGQFIIDNAVPWGPASGQKRIGDLLVKTDAVVVGHAGKCFW